MAAPTPVSSLVHSSTLVTAGIYLLIRFNNMFISWPAIGALFVIGILTILIAGLSAMFEDDIKKIVALSTLRQLGVIMMVLGAYKPLLAYYHLMLHAYFKAILFMCAGYTIHSIKDYQDIRTMGIANNNMPFIVNIIIVSNLRLCGLPFMRGFYSKDIILEYIIIFGVSSLVLLLTILATMLTMAYSLRLTIILGLNTYYSEPLSNSGEFDLYRFMGILLLFPYSIYGGYIIGWHTITTPQTVYMPAPLKLFIFLSLLLGIMLSVSIFNVSHYCVPGIKSDLSKNIYFMPYLYRNYSGLMFMGTGINTLKRSEML